MANPIVNTLPAYVDEKRLGLISKVVLGAETAKYVNRQSGIKGSAALNILSVDPVLADGSDCKFEAEGTSELTQRVLDTAMIKINMSFCDKKLVKKWAEYQVRIASGERTMPFEEEFVNDLVAKINAQTEADIWNADKNDGGLFDGFLAILTAAGDDVIKPELAEGASVYDAIMTAYNAIPEAVLDKAAIFVGADTYRQFIQEMVAKNYYHYSAGEGATREFVLPATDTKVIAVNGLNGTKTIVAADPENLYLGFDLEGEQENVDLWYSKDNDEFRFAVLFNLGTQVAFPDQVVEVVMA